MNPQSLLPAGILVVGALVALLLEVIGAPPGARKKLERVHLPWLIAGTCAAAAAATWWALGEGAIDRTSAVALAALLGLVAVTHVSAVGFLRSIDEERGELSAAYLLFGAGVSVAVCSTHLITVSAGLVLAGVAGAFLSAPDREGPHGIEAAARLVVSLGLLLTLSIVAAAFGALATGSVDLQALAGSAAPSTRITEALTIIVVATLAGVAPLHQRFVDVAHGAASSATSLLAAGGLLVGGVLALRLGGIEPSPRLDEVFRVLALVSLVGLPLAALSQIRVGRLVAYLAAAQAGVPLVALAAAATGAGNGIAMTGIVVGASAAGAALLGVTLATRHPAATWEDWSGYGRARPVVAALFIYALATCAGMPGTAGFLVRLGAARVAFSGGEDLLGLVCLLSVAVGAAPVVRLALFLFAKGPTSRRAGGSQLALGFILLVGASALAAAVPELLDALARFVDRGP